MRLCNFVDGFTSLSCSYQLLVVRVVANITDMLGQPVPICLLRARCDGNGVVAIGSGVVDHLLERHLVPVLLERGIGHAFTFF